MVYVPVSGSVTGSTNRPRLLTVFGVNMLPPLGFWIVSVGRCMELADARRLTRWPATPSNVTSAVSPGSVVATTIGDPSRVITESDAVAGLTQTKTVSMATTASLAANAHVLRGTLSIRKMSSRLRKKKPGLIVGRKRGSRCPPGG